MPFQEGSMTKQMADRIGIGALLLIFVVIAATIFASVPHHDDVMAQQMVPGSDPGKGPQAIAAYGCGTCHVIPGVPGADGTVGPKLDRIRIQSFLAGELPNTPDNLVRWIEHPQEVKPGVDMPDMRVSPADARNIAAYLYSLH
jgi:cytochrome c1